MKNSLLVFLLLSGCLTYSQKNKSLPGPRILVDGTISTPGNNGVTVLKNGVIELGELKNRFRNVPAILKPLPGEDQAQSLQPLPNGNRVFALPQDNMPCVVPNENGSVAMPNIIGIPTIPYRYKGPGAIPNPAMPILIEKPKKK